ncbi:hypothetical protein DPMN_168555 [Dreissena polymorpha]|uniref:Uncharacterized protein n=1 Tax=Dreissena polymorpha TaxID=45954 RepID=A0A9D4IZQ6_DREPO|nr:hypothetical protein DPMN_168555 [Dreissena polymorpha]
MFQPILASFPSASRSSAVRRRRMTGRQRAIMNGTVVHFRKAAQSVRVGALSPVRVFPDGNQHQHARQGATDLLPEPEMFHFGV